MRERERFRLVERHRDVTDRRAFDDLRPGRPSPRRDKSAKRGCGHDDPGRDAAEVRRPPSSTLLAIDRRRRPSVVRHFGSLQRADSRRFRPFYALPLRPDASCGDAITGCHAARRSSRSSSTVRP